jgi:methyltransferase (TIGR00027 family)
MDGISRTAFYVAAGRAIGAREPDPDVRNPDDIAEKLLCDPADLDLDLPVVRALEETYQDAMQDIEVASTVRSMAVRTRFIDEALERAVDGGATQLLILGAGFDSHAYRCQELLRDVAVFEVDRPAMQNWKRQRVRDMLGTPPANLRYVPVDFQTDSIEQIMPLHGYDFSRRTCVIMEGLTMYLPEESLRQTLSVVARHPPGSSAVFDFVTSFVIGALQHFDPVRLPEAARQSITNLLLLIRDEPWLFGFPVGKEREYLDEFGLEVRDLLTVSSDAAARRYLTRADGTQLGGEPLRRIAPPSVEIPTAQRDAMAYRIAEVAVAYKH